MAPNIGQLAPLETGGAFLLAMQNMKQAILVSVISGVIVLLISRHLNQTNRPSTDDHWA